MSLLATVSYYGSWFLPLKLGLAVLTTLCVKRVLMQKLAKAERIQAEAVSKNADTGNPARAILWYGLASIPLVVMLWVGFLVGIVVEIARGGMLGILSILVTLAALALIVVIVEFNLRVLTSPASPWHAYGLQPTTEAVQAETPQVETLFGYLVGQGKTVSRSRQEKEVR